MVNSLKRRLTLICAVSMGLVLMGMALVSLSFSSRQLREQYASAFASQRDTVFFYLRGQNGIDHTWLARTETSGHLWIALYHQGEPLLFNTQNPARGLLTARAGEIARRDYGLDPAKAPGSSIQATTVSFPFAGEGRQYDVVAANVPTGTDDWYHVILLRDLAYEEAELMSLRLSFLVTVLVAMACLIVVSWLFTAWAVRPVEESRKKQNEFISAASHELRSPLAVIRTSASAARTAPPEGAGRFLDTIDKECDRLGRLTGDLLSLAGSDSRTLSISKSWEDPQTLLLTAQERYEELAARKSIRLRVGLPEEELPGVFCDGQRIDQLLTILLDNALRHTPEGGVIRLSAAASRRHIRLSVADSGPGVPEAQREKVFQRFYRGDASRTDKEHYGLGLAVAAEIAALHKGSLTVTDAAEGGAAFVLCLPRGDHK